MGRIDSSSSFYQQHTLHSSCLLQIVPKASTSQKAMAWTSDCYVMISREMRFQSFWSWGVQKMTLLVCDSWDGNAENLLATSILYIQNVIKRNSKYIHLCTRCAAIFWPLFTTYNKASKILKCIKRKVVALSSWATNESLHFRWHFLRSLSINVLQRLTRKVQCC